MPSTKSDSFDGYHKWLGIPPDQQPPDFYRLLGIKRYENDPDVIENAGARQIAHVRSFRSGPYALECGRILNELSAARVCLTNPEQKARYDSTLRNRRNQRRAVRANPGLDSHSSTGHATAAPPPSAPPDTSDSSPVISLRVQQRGGRVAKGKNKSANRNKPPWLFLTVSVGMLIVALIVLFWQVRMLRLARSQEATQKNSNTLIHPNRLDQNAESGNTDESKGPAQSPPVTPNNHRESPDAEAPPQHFNRNSTNGDAPTHDGDSTDRRAPNAGENGDSSGGTSQTTVTVDSESTDGNNSPRPISDRTRTVKQVSLPITFNDATATHRFDMEGGVDFPEPLRMEVLKFEAGQQPKYRTSTKSVARNEPLTIDFEHPAGTRMILEFLGGGDSIVVKCSTTWDDPLRRRVPITMARIGKLANDLPRSVKKLDRHINSTESALQQRTKYHAQLLKAIPDNNLQRDAMRAQLIKLTKEITQFQALIENKKKEKAVASKRLELIKSIQRNVMPLHKQAHLSLHFYVPE